GSCESDRFAPRSDPARPAPMTAGAGAPGPVPGNRSGACPAVGVKMGAVAPARPRRPDVADGLISDSAQVGRPRVGGWGPVRRAQCAQRSGCLNRIRTQEGKTVLGLGSGVAVVAVEVSSIS